MSDGTETDADTKTAIFALLNNPGAVRAHIIEMTVGAQARVKVQLGAIEWGGKGPVEEAFDKLSKHVMTQGWEDFRSSVSFDQSRKEFILYVEEA